MERKNTSQMLSHWKKRTCRINLFKNSFGVIGLSDLAKSKFLADTTIEKKLDFITMETGKKDFSQSMLNGMYLLCGFLFKPALSTCSLCCEILPWEPWGSIFSVSRRGRGWMSARCAPLNCFCSCFISLYALLCTVIFPFYNGNGGCLHVKKNA